LFPNPENQTVSPLDFIQKGINVAILMQCGGLWFANGKFGITWKLVQAVVQKPKATLAGQCFIKLKASDKEKLKSLPLAPEPAFRDDDDRPSITKSFVDDSDGEDDQSDEVVRSPELVLEKEFVSQEVGEEIATLASTTDSTDEPKKKKIVKKKVAGASV
jgi:hypothetical protein